MARMQKGGPFTIALTKLRSHLRKCYECRVVAKGAGFGPMCEEGLMLTHQMAQKANRLSVQHSAAHRDPNGMIYPCPDITAHGLDYSSTAQPYMGVAVQERLF